MAQHVVEIDNLVFGWRPGQPLLDIETFHVAAGERVFLEGRSGGGKSTLLGLIAGVLSGGTGGLRLLDHDMLKLSAPKRDALRADRVGVIFQMFNLVPYLSAVDNVLLPCRFSTRRRRIAQQSGATLHGEASGLLERLGLSGAEIAGRNVTELSVGQQQRVAAARALIGAPELILADEPTSALDVDAQGAFLDILSEACRTHGTALILVSHDPSLASHCDRRVQLAAINRATPGGGS